MDVEDKFLFVMFVLIFGIILAPFGDASKSAITVIIIEPRHEKTCLRDLRPGKTQTGLLSYRS